MAAKGNVDHGGSHLAETWQITSGLLPLLQQPQRLSVIFSSIFKKQECLLWKRPAGKHRYEVLPTDVALILSLVEAGVGDLDRIGLPGSQIGSMIARGLAEVRTKQVNAGPFATV